MQTGLMLQNCKLNSHLPAGGFYNIYYIFLTHARTITNTEHVQCS